MTSLNGRYPKPADVDGVDLTIRLMTADDRGAIADFAQALPAHDLLFLSRKITEPKVMNAWAQQVETGELKSLIAFDGSKVAGCSAIVVDPYSWSPHVGELRVLIGEDYRNRGFGRVLVQESFLVAVDNGLEKLTARMTPDQQGAIAVFEDLGFKAEGLLRDHVQDESGDKHDLLVLSIDVLAAQSRMAQYGLDSAF